MSGPLCNREKIRMASTLSLRRDAVVVVMLCCGFALSASSASAQMQDLAADGAPAGKQLLLATGIVNTSVGGLPATDAVAKAKARPKSRFVVQLDGPMTPARRAALDAAGVALSDYLPENAYVADLSRADGAKLAALNFVQWTGVFQSAWKFSPEFNQRVFGTPERQQLAQLGKSVLHVTFFPGVDPADALAEIGAVEGASVASITPEGDRLVAAVIMNTADAPIVANFEEVQWAEEAPELTERNSTNRWVVQSNVTNVFPLYANGIRGEGQVLGIMDSAVDTAHCSFSDPGGNPIGPAHRKVVGYNVALGSVSHGTHCAGTAVGDAGADNDTRGVAYMGKLAYHGIPSFTDADMYNRLVTLHNQGARLHTNSWGNDGTTSYDGLARGVDRFSYDQEDSLVLFAVTNTSTLKNPENAKNCLAVGASQDTPSQGTFCSGGTGPTSDQRRKPEIFAPGCNTNSSANSTGCGTRALTGTSMACPAVTGTGMLVRQYFTDGFYPGGTPSPTDSFVPTGALIKATLLNSAVDMTGIAGFPSNGEGWGRVLADNALFFPGDTRKLVVQDVRNAAGLTTGAVADIAVNVVSSTEPLKITLVWTEPPAAAGVANATINNLDLEVIAADGNTYLGNVFTGGVSSVGGVADPRNNAEMVLLNAPAAGSYTVRIKGTAINQGTQGYALVVTGDVQTAPLGLSVRIESAVPLLALPGTVLNVVADIDPRSDSLVAGSPMLSYRLSGGSFINLPMTNTTGTKWQASLPPVNCDDAPQFFVSASGVSSGTINDPSLGASAPRSFSIGEFIQLYTDTYEVAATGWTVTNDATLTSGTWERAVPLGNGSQPGSDNTPGAGTFCFVTGNGTAGQTAGSTDVDGGPTTLTSPTIDLSGLAAASISYARWFSNDDNDADRLNVEVSNNDGATWVPLESIANAPAWNISTFNLGAVLPLTNQMRIRFITFDSPNNSVTDAAVDDIVIQRFSCEPLVPACPGDANGDQLVDLADVAIIIDNWETAGPMGDLDQSGTVDLADVAIVINNWAANCAG